jgi:N-acetylglucosaminyl-diphospho-decaprenol L-rhamnosyltransferase
LYPKVVSLVDVVIVSYNSRHTLRACVEPLSHDADFHVNVVDNASADGSLSAIKDLAVEACALPENRGFAAGCNYGWRRGKAPFVLFLNPDARINGDSVRRLVGVLEAKPWVGLVGPRIVDSSGTLEPSQRRFPRLASTFSQSLFLHRVFPRAPWTDELVRDARAYAESRSAEWLSGACLLARRDVLERVGGWDERFFLYGEDKDICRRVWDAGLEVVFEPHATVAHAGGASAPRSTLLPVLAASRIRYAHKHSGHAEAVLMRIGIALGAFTHMLAARKRANRVGHARALIAALRPTNRTAADPTDHMSQRANTDSTLHA